MVFSRNFVFLFLLVSLGFVINVNQISANETLPENSWKIPFDVNQRNYPPQNQLPIVTSQGQIYDFMWQSFVAMSWPWLTNGSRGQPDTEGNLAPWGTGQESQGPVVWETYRKPNEVFTEPRQWPIHWDDEVPQALCSEEGDLTGIRTISASSTNYSDNSDGLNQPFIQANYPTGPAVDQNGNFLRYEVGLNQSFFSYISHFRYYNPTRQIRSVKRYIRYVEKNSKAPPSSNKRYARYFQQMPNGTEAYLTKVFQLPEYALQGIVEWKSAWKILDGDDDPDRFYWRNLTFQNPDGSCTEPVQAGLIALHIHRFTQFGHIGTTFEQVDNTNLQSEYSTEQVHEAAKLPKHASLNPGGIVAPVYDNGYQICDADGNNCQSGFGGMIPKPIKTGEALPAYPDITNITRQVGIPQDVQDINAKWRKRLKGTVWFYYQMIGTQNENLNFEPNPNLGPGVIGAQVSNTRNLINTALESYTQEGWSCAQCHQHAFPLGVSLPFPPLEQEFAPLHTISFLLQNAQKNRKR